MAEFLITYILLKIRLELQSGRVRRFIASKIMLSVRSDQGFPKLGESSPVGALIVSYQ
jgi:hypothetical protein